MKKHTFTQMSAYKREYWSFDMKFDPKTDTFGSESILFEYVSYNTRGKKPVGGL